MENLKNEKSKTEFVELTKLELKELADFNNKLIDSQEPLETDFCKILNENFWELL